MIIEDETVFCFLKSAINRNPLMKNYKYLFPGMFKAENVQMCYREKFA
jgi:hypothetical protein